MLDNHPSNFMSSDAATTTTEVRPPARRRAVAAEGDSRAEWSNRSIKNENAKKGLSDDVKDIQIKALQTGFENGLERMEKEEAARLKMLFRANSNVVAKRVNWQTEEL
ncbi:hypothetical protein WR25_20892 [Diploscapter pachys]|uniref:Uncharacterized protein n=1 Tax=Diploscapter pachys TaxID=2018661 RepID=A0A2A2KT49_9BILA|nr:hypothetical protein WR25_20892 [Diploscapter pachys]